MKTNHSSRILMRVAVVLLCLVFVSAHLTSGMFAKYTTSTDNADTSRVAIFRVGADSAEAEVIPVPNGDGSYTFTVWNDSEVVVKYDVRIIFDDNPEFTADEAVKDPKLDSLSTGFSGNTLNYTDVGQLGVGESRPHTFRFTVEDILGDEVKTIEYGFTIIVRFVQVD